MPTVITIVGIVLVAVAGVIYYLLSRPEPPAVYTATGDTAAEAPRGGTR